jgi:hypothetical protein
MRGGDDKRVPVSLPVFSKRADLVFINRLSIFRWDSARSVHSLSASPEMRQKDDPELLGSMPDLPPPSVKRWTTRRKAAVLEAVRGGWVPIEEVCQTYRISVDEFLAWKRDVDQFGTPGLRATRLQIYHGKARSAQDPEGS